MIRIGTAAWAVPVAVAGEFAGGGTHLQRYATRFDATEINSTFKHTHRAATFARWAESTPPGFRFAVKLPHAITHERRLGDASTLVATFLEAIAPLGERLGPLLVQLPASAAFEIDVARTFFAELRRQVSSAVVLEARHASWFDAGATALLIDHRIGTVAADPPRVPAATAPGGWLGGDGERGVAYFRWHGSPRVYHSPYSPQWIADRALEVVAMHATCECWCIFDNTASGAAATNALALLAALHSAGGDAVLK